MTDRVEQEKPEKLKKSSWWWPGVVASSLAGAAVLAFRGCWHRNHAGSEVRMLFITPLTGNEHSWNDPRDSGMSA